MPTDGYEPPKTDDDLLNLFRQAQKDAIESWSFTSPYSDTIMKVALREIYELGVENGWESALDSHYYDEG